MRCEEIDEQRKKKHPTLSNHWLEKSKDIKTIYQAFIGNVLSYEFVVNDASIFSLRISVGFVRSLLVLDRRTLALRVYG
jgi:hypothetical protein